MSSLLVAVLLILLPTSKGTATGIEICTFASPRFILRAKANATPRQATITAPAILT